MKHSQRPQAITELGGPEPIRLETLGYLLKL